MTTFQRVTYKTWLALAGVTAFAPIASAVNLGSNDPGGELPEGSNLDLRGLILDIVGWVLNFLALLAVIYIIIAGIRLIVSQGDDDQKGKAKKTIMYVVVGLIVIILARVIVGFVTTEVPNIVN
jgi:type IV secretory pathway VirB2 component (pilin)